MTNEFQTKLLMTTSLKGGTGKSLFACAAIDYFRQRGTKIAAYDADGAIGTVSKMFAENDTDGRRLTPQTPTTGVVGYNVRDKSRDKLIESLGWPDQLILHDLAGGALQDVMRIFDDQDGLEKFFRTFDALGVQPIFAHIITPDSATVESVAIHLDMIDALGELGRCARHLAVLNMRGKLSKDDFPIWFGYEDTQGRLRGGITRQRLLDAGGIELSMPHLNEKTLALMKALDIPFSKATTDRSLLMADQQRIRMFSEDFSAEMTPDVLMMLGVPHAG